MTEKELKQLIQQQKKAKQRVADMEEIIEEASELIDFRNNIQEAIDALEKNKEKGAAVSIKIGGISYDIPDISASWPVAWNKLLELLNTFKEENEKEFQNLKLKTE